MSLSLDAEGLPGLGTAQEPVENLCAALEVEGSVRLIAELSGGYTGARLFQASEQVTPSDPQPFHLVFKVGPSRFLREEVERYQGLAPYMRANSLFAHIIEPERTLDTLPPNSPALGAIVYEHAAAPSAGKDCISLTKRVEQAISGEDQLEEVEGILAATVKAIGSLYGEPKPAFERKVTEYYLSRWAPDFRVTVEEAVEQDKNYLLTLARYRPEKFQEEPRTSTQRLRQAAESPSASPRIDLVLSRVWNGRPTETDLIVQGANGLCLALDLECLSKDTQSRVAAAKALALWASAKLEDSRYGVYLRRLNGSFSGQDFGSSFLTVGRWRLHNPLKHLSGPLIKRTTGRTHLVPAHGDLHPGNVQVVGNVPVIIDYGLADLESPVGADPARLLGGIVREVLSRQLTPEDLVSVLLALLGLATAPQATDTPAARAWRLLDGVQKEALGLWREIYRLQKVDSRDIDALWPIHLYGYSLIGLKWDADPEDGFAQHRASGLLAAVALTRLLGWPPSQAPASGRNLAVDEAVTSVGDPIASDSTSALPGSTLGPAPAPPSVAAPPELPRRPLFFVGREQEAATLVGAVLRAPPSPALVLGPPGVGKTHLCLSCLHDEKVARYFGDRRFFAQCDGARDLDALIAVMAAALPLGAEISQGRMIQDLARTSSLLVLDNVETPWEEPSREPVEKFFAQLAAISGLALVLSTRGNQRPAGVHWGETVLLHPLAIERASELFLQVARPREPAEPYLEQLLTAVDGLPLAIMLLAYQMDASPSLEDLWLRWQSEKTALLRRAGGEDRDTNLEVSVMLSVHGPRLTGTPTAVRLASLLSILPDGAEAADLSAFFQEDVSSADSTLREAGLADASALRLRLLAPIREVLLRHLPPSTTDEERLTAFFRELAHRANAVGTGEQAEAVQRLRPEIRNLDAILSNALEKKDPAPAVMAALSLTRLQRVIGVGGYGLISKAVAAAKKADLRLLMASCLLALGDLASSRRDQGTATAAYEDSLGHFRSLGDQVGVASCLKALGFLAYLHADLDTAESRDTEALAAYSGIGDVPGQASCIENLGDIAFQRHKHDDAHRQYEEALRRYRESEHKPGLASAAEKLSNVAARQFYRLTALDWYQTALDLYHEAGDLLGQSRCKQGLGDIARQGASYAAASARYEEALDLSRRSGSVIAEAACKEKLGDVAVDSARYDDARCCYREARTIYQRAGDVLGEAGCTLSLGAIALKTSDLPEADKTINEALARYQAAASPIGEAECFLCLGRLAVATSDRRGARDIFERARRIYRDGRDSLGEARCLGDLAGLAHLEGDTAEAHDLLGRALELYERISDQLSIGTARRLLARWSPTGPERSEHVAAARRAWESIGRSDLVAELDEELKERALSDPVRTQEDTGEDRAENERPTTG
jgi:tetratricopeptide (TPR) repeat protein